MAKVKIDGKEYDTAKLPQEALDLLNSIAYVDAKLRDHQNEVKLLQAARALYSNRLKEILDKVPETNN